MPDFDVPCLEVLGLEVLGPEVPGLEVLSMGASGIELSDETEEVELMDEIKDIELIDPHRCLLLFVLKRLCEASEDTATTVSLVAETDMLLCCVKRGRAWIH